jgi:hypothetical protein
MSAQMTLVSSPVTFTTPASSTRWYFGAEMSELINGQIYILLPYSDPYPGNTTLQSLTYLGYTVSVSGSVSQDNALANWVNALGPQNIPLLYQEGETRNRRPDIVIGYRRICRHRQRQRNRDV